MLFVCALNAKNFLNKKNNNKIKNCPDSLNIYTTDIVLLSLSQANNYLFKVNCRSTKKSEICSELIIKTPERCQRCHSGVSTVNFEHISHLFLVFLLLT